MIQISDCLPPILKSILDTEKEALFNSQNKNYRKINIVGMEEDNQEHIIYNQQLFVFVLEHATWKINVYSLSKLSNSPIFILSLSTKEIYQQKLNSIIKWNVTSREKKETHIMLDSIAVCSTIPSNSYPIERKSKTGF